MRYLLDGKIYDTEKSEKIIKYKKGVEHKGLFLTTYPEFEHTIYKTPKGNFFVHVGKYLGEKDISYKDTDYIELISTSKVKEVLEQLNDVDIYEKIFRKIEEG